MADIRPSFSAAQDAFGLDATVTIPGGSPVATRVVWLPPRTAENPSGLDHRRAEALRVLALPAAQVPDVPRGTVVSVPESEGAAVSSWRVDAAERLDFDHYRAVVVPA